MKRKREIDSFDSVYGLIWILPATLEASREAPLALVPGIGDLCGVGQAPSCPIDSPPILPCSGRF